MVDRLKQRWLASHQGYVAHSFWVKVEPQVLAIYLLLYLGLIVVFGALNLWLAGAIHWGSLFCITAPGAILLALGRAYSLRRYWIGGATGILLSGLVEWFLTTHAAYQKGPRGFLDASPEIGNPAVPLLIWAGIFLVSGIVGLLQVLRKHPDER